jgi:metal-responsive CopG/Arc/MetJ family transcriptional regulator
MKVKASITISEDLLKTIDERAKLAKKNRSDFIESAVRSFLQQQYRNELNERDLAIINERADALNEDVADVLSYQVPL